ncbi:hypothetical protein PanWU01x14_214940 [Parasponia andersonii]|uniref:Transmembrane protein n=1 Tax=Parasponia andersonii TaxID=3476 RepID=A0A2P5BRY0_PARAD|nr:hypothetical protein PanWU01x14_214940 [Parasponia andersonii]
MGHEIPTMRLPIRRRVHDDQFHGELQLKSSSASKTTHEIFYYFLAIVSFGRVAFGGGLFVWRQRVDSRWWQTLMAAEQVPTVAGHGEFVAGALWEKKKKYRDL